MPDRRRWPARTDLAAAHLRGEVDAARFRGPEPCCIIVPSAPLRLDPDATQGWATELLLGEPFACYDRADGWAWGQSEVDDYVGYVPVSALGKRGAAPTHRVVTLGAQAYASPMLKSAPAARLPFGARIAVTAERDGFAESLDNGWIPLPQLAPLAAPAPDWIAEAERFLGVPYIWGGRSDRGLDCSALVQLARLAAGHACPRDSDMQCGEVGVSIPETASLRRGDLIFWRGHVGIMRDAETLLHANAHHMAVASEPLATAVRRIEGAGGGPITRRARPEG